MCVKMLKVLNLFTLTTSIHCLAQIDCISWEFPWIEYAIFFKKCFLAIFLCFEHMRIILKRIVWYTKIHLVELIIPGRHFLQLITLKLLNAIMQFLESAPSVIFSLDPFLKSNCTTLCGVFLLAVEILLPSTYTSTWHWSI